VISSIRFYQFIGLMSKILDQDRGLSSSQKYKMELLFLPILENSAGEARTGRRCKGKECGDAIAAACYMCNWHEVSFLFLCLFSY